MGSSIVYKLIVKYVVSPFDTLVIKYDKKIIHQLEINVYSWLIQS
jgi:hypothetical protein